MGLPKGTVTFVFTDIEGSTRLLDELGPVRYEEALQEHRATLRRAFEAQGGVEVDTQGDAFFVVFERATDALVAAAELTQGLSRGPIRVRVGIHTGEPLVTDEGYVGIDVHRAARIAAAGHGGQVLVSQATRDLVLDVPLRDLGEHRLKDLTRAERLFQLGDSEFPPLKSLNRTNLPLAAGPLLGRERELATVERLVADGERLVTLTGAGGSGKTRLALQVAAELVEDFPDGVFFVGLASVGDAAIVEGAIAEAVGLSADDDVCAALAHRRALIVLDNAEHLDIAPLVVRMLDAARQVVLLVTSRVPLHVSLEHEFAVDPLDSHAAVELFVIRAGAAGAEVMADATVAAICRRVDGLPLAVELAAARAKVLAPNVLLARLEQALPLLTGGSRDSPERQRTLSATISWSYDLLDEPGRRALRRLSVFRGGMSLDAAEAIADSSVDTLSTLVDHSLLKRAGDGRFLMLETIREFAAEQLAEAAETLAAAEEHARWYLNRLREYAPILRGPRTAELLAWYDRESANTWAALETLSKADPEAALAMANELGPYWIAKARMQEGRAWLERLLTINACPSHERGLALARLGDLADRLGDLVGVEALCHEAARIAREIEDDFVLATALNNLAWFRKEQRRSDEARDLAREALAAAVRSNDPRLMSLTRSTLASSLRNLRHFEEAQELYAENLTFHSALGDDMNTATTLVNLAGVAIDQERYADAQALETDALTILAQLGEQTHQIPALQGRALAALALREPDTALRDFTQALERSLQTGTILAGLECVGGIAIATCENDPIGAAQAWHACLATLDRRGALPYSVLHDLGQERMADLAGSLDGTTFATACEEGSRLNENEAISLAIDLARRAGATIALADDPDHRLGE